MPNDISIGPIMFDIKGTELTAEDKEILKHPMIGGLIYFAGNYENKAQLTNLSQQVRQINPNILIAVDQEGGRVQRFQNEFTRIPAMETLGLQFQDNPAQALMVSFNWGKTMAEEIMSVGVDFSFAPVLDLNKNLSSIIGDRSFSDDLDTLIALAKQFIEGVHAAGSYVIGKHFPGHGSVVADSHLELPTDNRELAEIAEDDMQPFAILAKHLDGMMPAHILYPKVDDKPVSFSKHWLQDILRNELGFNGVVFSDSLHMEGAKIINDPTERTALALEAGCDMALLCQDRDALISVLDNAQQIKNYLTNDRLSNFKNQECVQ